MSHILKRLRDGRGLSQGVLAQSLGLSRDQVTKIEIGRRAVRLSEFLRVVEVFRLTPAAALSLARELAGEPTTDSEDEDLAEDPGEILTPRPLPGAA